MFASVTDDKIVLHKVNPINKYVKKSKKFLFQSLDHRKASNNNKISEPNISQSGPKIVLLNLALILD